MCLSRYVKQSYCYRAACRRCAYLARARRWLSFAHVALYSTAHVKQPPFGLVGWGFLWEAHASQVLWVYNCLLGSFVFFGGLCSKQQAAKLHEPCTVIFSPCAEHLQTGLRHFSTFIEWVGRRMSGVYVSGLGQIPVLATYR